MSKLTPVVYNQKHLGDYTYLYFSRKKLLRLCVIDKAKSDQADHHPDNLIP